MKIDDILKALTIEEKVYLTSGRNLWQFLGNERLGIKKLRCADGPHGVRTYNTETLENEMILRETLNESTMFPVAAAMAATFNESLIYEVGKTIGEECNMYDVDLLLAPGVNLKRSPLGGRNFEYYSEDPVLTTKMGSAFVKGVQSTGVGATIKHFALNEQETQRRYVDTLSDEKTMHELYLYPFAKIIQDANPSMIMSAYNKVNGSYAGESKELLTDILRNKWNYEGAVISDWTSIQDKVKSIKNGLNLEMPKESELYDDVFLALEKGTLTEKDLDTVLRPLLLFREHAIANKNKFKKTSLKDNHVVASRVSQEAIVLLENDGILPLKNVSKIGVVGDFAQNPRVNGGGSATLKAHKMEIPLTELSSEFEVDYAQGYIEENTTDELLSDVEKVCENNDVILFFTGTTEALESEGRERPHIKIPEGHEEVYKRIVQSNKDIIVVLSNGSALDLRIFKEHASAIVETWLLGGANAKAIVDVLAGRVNPSGRLSETFPLQIEHTPFYGEYPVKQEAINYHGDILRLGYRYYDLHDYPVAYPFGYGLSYTTFVYSDLKLSKETLLDEGVDVMFKVENTGEMGGFVVPQIYLQDLDSYYARPKKELKAFKKVYLEAKESKTIKVSLTVDDFKQYSVDFSEFRIETGDFMIMVADNVSDVRLKQSVFVDTKIPFRKALDETQPITNFILYKPEVVTLLEELYGPIPWYDQEQPMKRILFRIKRDNHLSQKEFEELRNKILQ